MSTSERSADGRDTRLLLVTLVISAGMLLLLARFRFPVKPAMADGAPVPAPAPLERLAARATYGELASILAGLDQQVASAIVPLRVPADRGARAIAGLVDVPAIRVSAERGVALVGPGRSAHTLLAKPDIQGVLAVDAPRGIVLVNLPPTGGEPWRPVETADPVAAPGYAASVEMTPNGRATRPFYFGRVDRIEHPRWGGSVLRFSGLQQVPPPGAAIFLLDGGFVGLGVPEGDAFVVVPASMLRDAVTRLESSGTIDVADAGLEVAALDEPLKLALAVDSGVAITHVTPGGPAAASLRAGDVIQRIGDQEVRSVDDYGGAIARVAAGEQIAIAGRRRNTPISVTLVTTARGRLIAESSRQLGLDLRALAGVGTEVVRVTPRTAGALAGIVAGDVITLLGDDAAPTPAAIRRAFERATDGARLVAGVQRARDHHLLVIEKP